MSISYSGSTFEAPIEKCYCGKKAEFVKADVRLGSVMNFDTGERYIDCDFIYLCKKHETT